MISIGALGRVLSPERLAGYRDAAQDRDDTDGVARYLWNMALGLASPGTPITIILHSREPNEYGWSWLRTIGFRGVSLDSNTTTPQDGFAQTQEELYRNICVNNAPEHPAALLLALSRLAEGEFDGVLPVTEERWLELFQHPDPHVRTAAILHPHWFNLVSSGNEVPPRAGEDREVDSRQTPKHRWGCKDGCDIS